MRSLCTGWLLALLVSMGLLLPFVTQATHVRAGEITVRRVPGTATGSALTYEITLTTYYDVSNPRSQDAANAATEAWFCLGDNTPSRAIPRSSIRRFSAVTTVNSYTFTYTYSGPGTYVISARVINRNDQTRNINRGNSLEVNFFITTTISANAALGLNSSPLLLNPPVDTARVGQRYCHNPAAFDPDGDSLSYHLAIPQQSFGQDGTLQACRSVAVPAYVYPNQVVQPGRTEAGGSPARFTVDSLTGDVCWDAPMEAGQYNYAFVIREWRQGVLIGEITRDVQVIVIDDPNRRPLIDPIADVCAVAGQTIRQTITATDPDGHRVVFQGFGGPFNRSPEGVLYQPEIIRREYATLTPSNTGVASPATSTFNWQTNCGQLRQEPYQITIRVNDVPPRPTPTLVSYESFNVKLIGQQPESLTAQPVTGAGSGRAIQLNWSAYTCLPPTPPADQQPSQMLVYRREGCDNRRPGPCQTGILPGYTQVGSTSLTATTFTDTTDLQRGVTYTYRLVAQYALPTGGESVVSDPVCITLPLLAPVLTQVTVDSTGPATGPTRGIITVRWSRPIGLSPNDGGSPFEYRLFRATGLTGTNYTQLTAVRTTLAPNVVDTVFVDRGLNTQAEAFRYRLEFFVTNPAGQLVRQDVSDAATSVRLATTPGSQQISLAWQADTPWSNDNQTHRVYRSRRGPTGPFNLIAEVAVQGPASYTYVDRGNDLIVRDGNTSGALSVDSSYCYRVETVGRYEDPVVRARTGTILNFSQIQCASPADTTRPCAPNLTLDLLNCADLSAEAFCNQTTFTNTLRWTYPAQAGGRTCDPRIVSYNVYYSRYEGDSLRRIATVPHPTTTYLHQNLTTVAGCYVVTAVNVRGTESLPSNRVCKDICPLFALPNLFTPNGDGKNDVFQPLRCPRFVESVTFVVYNRWGARVYESSGPVLAWNGKTSDGKDLPGGVYYYEATVRYVGLSRDGSPQSINGYVQLIRDAVGMK